MKTPAKRSFTLYVKHLNEDKVARKALTAIQRDVIRRLQHLWQDVHSSGCIDGDTISAMDGCHIYIDGHGVDERWTSYRTVYTALPPRVWNTSGLSDDNFQRFLDDQRPAWEADLQHIQATKYKANPQCLIHHFDADVTGNKLYVISGPPRLLMAFMQDDRVVIPAGVRVGRSSTLCIPPSIAVECLARLKFDFIGSATTVSQWISRCICLPPYGQLSSDGWQRLDNRSR